MGLWDSVKKGASKVFGGGSSSGGGGWSGGDWIDAAGTAIGLYSDYKSSKESKKSGKDQAKEVERAAKENKKLSLYDASVAEKEAAEAWKATGRNLVLHYQMGRQLLGAQRAAVSKSGAVATTGTPLEVMEDTMFKLDRDADVIVYEGRKAVDQRMALAHRYEMLAEAGLRDAAAAATLIEKTADYKAQQYQYQSAQRSLQYLGRNI